jgi:putative nucleotidyltransferase with HDIG domain
MFGWILSLFPRRARPAAEPRPQVRHGVPQGSAAAPAPVPGPRPALPGKSGLALDHESTHGKTLAEREQQLLARVGLRVERRQIELPQLPSTSLGALDLCARPHVEISDIVALIERDPVLSSELLRISNSVLYAAHEPAHTLQDAVVRVGLRTLRSMLYSVSVRGAILGDRSLAAYAEEVWRQASSCGAIARALAKPLRIEAERAYLIGLLHDVGKLPLLAMLRKAVTKESEVTPALVGRMFRQYHEEAGAALARAWRLPEELIEVAGRHHDFASHGEHAAAAALASLVHKLDLFLALGAEQDFRGLLHAPELEALGVPVERRPALLALAQTAFEAELGERATR